jgi:hypothetical protein
VTNQIHFYTMVTSIIASSVFTDYTEKELIRRIVSFGNLIDGGRPPKAIVETIEKYRELSAKHTTHPGRREDRQAAFLTAIAAL